jgi:hypothetical protein
MTPSKTSSEKNHREEHLLIKKKNQKSFFLQIYFILFTDTYFIFLICITPIICHLYVFPWEVFSKINLYIHHLTMQSHSVTENKIILLFNDVKRHINIDHYSCVF